MHLWQAAGGGAPGAADQRRPCETGAGTGMHETDLADLAAGEGEGGGGICGRNAAFPASKQAMSSSTHSKNVKQNTGNEMRVRNKLCASKKEIGNRVGIDWTFLQNEKEFLTSHHQRAL